MHALRVGGPWTPALLISGAEPADTPSVLMVDGVVYVQYRTSTSLFTVEIVIILSAGGSDDIDPQSGNVQPIDGGSIKIHRKK